MNAISDDELPASCNVVHTRGAPMHIVRVTRRLWLVMRMQYIYQLNALIKTYTYIRGIETATVCYHTENVKTFNSLADQLLLRPV